MLYIEFRYKYKYNSITLSSHQVSKWRCSVISTYITVLRYHHSSWRTDWQPDELTHSLTNWLTAWRTDLQPDELTYSLTNWLTAWRTDSQPDELIHLSEELIHPSDRLTHRSDGLTQLYDQLMTNLTYGKQCATYRWHMCTPPTAHTARKVHTVHPVHEVAIVLLQ